MVGGAQIAALGDHGMRPDVDFSQGVQNRFISDPCVIADGQFPWIGNGGVGPYHYMFADPRAKASKQPAAEAIGKLRRSAEKHAIDQPPKLHNQCRPSAEIWRQLKQRKVLQHKLSTQKMKTIGD
jgi:hypothetical protein